MSKPIYIPKETLEALYKIHTKKEVAKLCGCGLWTIDKLFKEYGIKIDKSKGKNVQITQVIKDVAIGSLLGDGYIDKRCLNIAHSVKQKEYMEYKSNLIADICNGKMYGRKDNGKLTSYRMRTYHHDYYDVLRNEWYKERKIIPKTIKKDLTPLAIAIWYMDDGCLRGKDCGRIATCSFDKEEVELLTQSLNSRYGLNVRVMKECKYYNIYIPKKSFLIFREVIKPYVPECMQYKLFKV